MNQKIQEYLNDNCWFLSPEEIQNMNLHDRGEINNVLNYRHNNCYGLWLFDDNSDENYILFYINNLRELKGLGCKINIHDNLRNEITFGFSTVVAEHFSVDTELIECYNSFQEQTATLLGKLGYFVYGDEVEKNRTIVLKNKKGAKYVPSLEKKSFLKQLFDYEVKYNETKENYIYLMFNPRNGLTKIGRSINPYVREKTLQGEDPETFILKSWKAEKKIESTLQKLYIAKRIRGEWFDLTVKEIIEIKNTMEDYNLL